MLGECVFQQHAFRSTYLILGSLCLAGMLAVFFLATYSMSDPGSAAEIFAVLFPVSSPYAMVARAAQSPVLWTHLLALAWQILWVAIFVKTGATLFRRKVMKSGRARGKGAKRRGLLRR